LLSSSSWIKSSLSGLYYHYIACFDHIIDYTMFISKVNMFYNKHKKARRRGLLWVKDPK